MWVIPNKQFVSFPSGSVQAPWARVIPKALCSTHAYTCSAGTLLGQLALPLSSR